VRRLFLALPLVAAGLVGACSSAPASSPHTPAHLTVAVVPITDAVPYFEAVRNGYFRQAGLDVTTEVTAQSTAATGDLVRGSVQVIAAANYVNFFQADAKGILSVKVIAAGTECGTGTQSVLALPGSGITKPADLPGKSIAVNISPNIQTLTIDEQLKADNVSPASVHFVQIPFVDMLTALKAHRVDAISEVEPFVSQARITLGAQTVLQQCTGPTANIPLAGYIATSQWAGAHPALARAFQQAVQRGQALAAESRAADEKTLLTFAKISPDIAAVVRFNNFPTRLDATQLQRVADLMQTGGMLAEPLNVGPLLFH
jgi:NitT/TauT family transport system substrate-binding protein